VCRHTPLHCMAAEIECNLSDIAEGLPEGNTGLETWSLIDQYCPKHRPRPLKQPQGNPPLTRGFASMRAMAWMVLPRPIRSNRREPDGI